MIANTTRSSISVKPLCRRAIRLPFLVRDSVQSYSVALREHIEDIGAFRGPVGSACVAALQPGEMRRYIRIRKHGIARNAPKEVEFSPGWVLQVLNPFDEFMQGPWVPR